MREAATGNVLSPTVDCRDENTINEDFDDHLNLCLELMLAIHVEVRHRDIPAPAVHENSRSPYSTDLAQSCVATFCGFGDVCSHGGIRIQGPVLLRLS